MHLSRGMSDSALWRGAVSSEPALADCPLPPAALAGAVRESWRTPAPPGAVSLVRLERTHLPAQRPRASGGGSAPATPEVLRPDEVRGCIHGQCRWKAFARALGFVLPLRLKSRTAVPVIAHRMGRPTRWDCGAPSLNSSVCLFPRVKLLDSFGLADCPGVY